MTRSPSIIAWFGFFWEGAKALAECFFWCFFDFFAAFFFPFLLYFLFDPDFFPLDFFELFEDFFDFFELFEDFLAFFEFLDPDFLVFLELLDDEDLLAAPLDFDFLEIVDFLLF